MITTKTKENLPLDRTKKKHLEAILSLASNSLHLASSEASKLFEKYYHLNTYYGFLKFVSNRHRKLNIQSDFSVLYFTTKKNDTPN